MPEGHGLRLDYAQPRPQPRGWTIMLVAMLVALGMLFVGMGMLAVRTVTNPPPTTVPARAGSAS